MLLRQDDHILFFGDSITDCGRNGKGKGEDYLGDGYVAMVAKALRERHGELNLRITNRGISGNHVSDLAERLQTDVIDLEPTVVSVMIGINDTWHKFDRGRASPLDEFAATYERICRRITGDLAARLIVCEPFLLHTPPDRAEWRVDLDPRIHAARRVAQQFASVYVPLDGIFAAAACTEPAEHWTGDGVHPTPAGHSLIADAWLRAVCGQLPARP